MAFNLDAALRLAVNVSGQNKIVAFGRSLEGLQGRVKNTAASLLTLNGALAALGAGAVIAKIFGDAATLQSQTRSLEVLTGSAEKAAEIVQQLRAFAGVTPFESVELIEVGKRLNAFGVEADQVVATTRRLGDVAGATGANLGELATAYGQVVAKGRLQGEELLQFQERGVALSDELRKMYGLSREEFTKALESGRISSEAVTVALQRLTDQGGKYAGGAIAQSETLNGRLSTLLDGITNLSQTIGTLLEPALKGILNLGIQVVGLVDSGIRGLVQGFQDAYRESNLFRGALAAVVGALTTLAAIQVFSTFIAGARAAIAITGNLIKALRALTAANLLAGIAGFFKSKPGLIAALIGGLGIGLDAAFNDGRVVKAIGSGISRALDQVFSTFGANVSGLLDLPALPKAGDIPALLEQRGAADRERKAAEAAAKKQEQLLERRQALTERVTQLQRELSDAIDDTNRKISGVGADPFRQLDLERQQSIAENTRLIDQLTLKVVELSRQASKLGDKFDVSPFRQLINDLSRANVDLANKTFSDGLAEVGEKASEAALKTAGLSVALEDQKNALTGVRSGIDQYLESLGTLAENVSNITVNAFKGLEDSIVSLTTTGTFSFRQFALSVIQDLTRMVTRMFIIAPALRFIQSLIPGSPFVSAGANLTGVGALATSIPGFSLNAMGNVFAQNGIKKFARGGVVNSPTIFPFANGIGLMGEAGPEAILPLRRGRDGRLGVESAGAGNVSVVVNVDASGSQVQGDQNQARALGGAISAAVQAEIVRQQRPGGLLAGTR